MQTVDKALKLLNLFSVARPEIGLSELSRMAGFDKAATRRFLVALQNHQFIEQNPDTKAYRLGIGFLHLAKIREATFPIESIVQPALERITEKTGETAHGSLLINNLLSTIGVAFSGKRMNRVHLDIGETIPFHATASGIAFLAFSDGETQEQLLSGKLTQHTDETVTDQTALNRILANAKQAGVARIANTYCDETTGLSVPIFDASGHAIGALAVATPSSRFNDSLAALITSTLLEECQDVTLGIGGQLPATFEKARQAA